MELGRRLVVAEGLPALREGHGLIRDGSVLLLTHQHRGSRRYDCVGFPDGTLLTARQAVRWANRDGTERKDDGSQDAEMAEMALQYQDGKTSARCDVGTDFVATGRDGDRTMTR